MRSGATIADPSDRVPLKAKLLTFSFLLLLVASLLAACGGDELSKGEYSQRLGEALGPVLDTEDLSLGGERIDEGLEAFQGRVGAAVSRLEGLDVPSEVEDENDDLILTLIELQESVVELRGAVAGDDQRAGRRALQDYQQRVEELDQISQRLEQEGVPQPRELRD